MFHKMFEVIGIVTVLLVFYNLGVEMILRSYNNTVRLSKVISMSDFKIKRKKK